MSSLRRALSSIRVCDVSAASSICKSSPFDVDSVALGAHLLQDTELGAGQILHLESRATAVAMTDSISRPMATTPPTCSARIGLARLMPVCRSGGAHAKRSAARNTALRERGLARTSASLARTAPPIGRNRRWSWSSAPAAPSAAPRRGTRRE
jgi:hypothetical protein